MVRIGLITLYSEDNPGQFFQALATLNMLKSLFPQAQIEIPDVQHWEQAANPGSRRDTLFRPWRNAARRRRRAKFDDARRKNFPLTGPKLVTRDSAEAVREIAGRNYDLLVVGSDVVLRLWGERRVIDNLPPLHWLYGLPDVPRVMISSCCNTLRYSQVGDRQREIMSKALKDFCFISVRDPLTMELIKSVGPAENTPLYISPDPTFSYQIDFKAADAQAVKEHVVRKKKPICGVRIPWKTEFSKRLVKRLSRDFDIFELSPFHIGCRPLIDLGPFEWSGIFSKFSLYVTTSFHETIFSFKQGTPVYTLEGTRERFDSETGKSKGYFLHEDMGTMANHYFNPFMSGVTADQMYQTISDTWREFDSEKAINRTKELGANYLAIAQRMKETVSPLLHLSE